MKTKSNWSLTAAKVAQVVILATAEHTKTVARKLAFFKNQKGGIVHCADGKNRRFQIDGNYVQFLGHRFDHRNIF